MSYGSGGTGIDMNVEATFKTKQEQNQCGLVKNHKTRSEKIWDLKKKLFI